MSAYSSHRHRINRTIPVVRRTDDRRRFRRLATIALVALAAAPISLVVASTATAGAVGDSCYKITTTRTIGPVGDALGTNGSVCR